jgi:replicative DNA helicase
VNAFLSASGLRRIITPHAMSEDSSNPVSPAARKSVPAADRIVPHSIEAEEYLLSCCFLGGGDVLSRCLEAGIGPGSFCVPAHRVIYERLLVLYEHGEPIGASVVAEELKAIGPFNSSGEYSFLTKVSSRVAATAYAGIFIEGVRELSLMRNIVRSATRAVGECCILGYYMAVNSG